MPVPPRPETPLDETNANLVCGNYGASAHARSSIWIAGTNFHIDDEKDEPLQELFQYQNSNSSDGSTLHESMRKEKKQSRGRRGGRGASGGLRRRLDSSVRCC